jgi:glucose-1-phosphate adenylyltransferase
MSAGDALTVVLGGGRGSRLHPLTSKRAKPAVPLAGKYRLIDIPISNAINSGLRQIFVLTQFNSASLNSHIATTYRFDPFSTGYVMVLAAEQTASSGRWYQGTADAVRQQLHRFFRAGIEKLMILAGDHLYRMDYGEMLARHEETGAEITVAAIPVDRSGCSGFGVLACDAKGIVHSFREKPADDEDLTGIETPASLRKEWGMGERRFLASMGVYVFDLHVLQELLEDESLDDFGGDVLPKAIHEKRVVAHLFDGYWGDIGTIGAFYEANLALCGEDSPFRFFHPEAPIYTRPRFLPPSVIRKASIEQTMIADGCQIVGARVTHSIVGLRSTLQLGCDVRDSIVMGADYYETDQNRGQPPIGIGPGASIRHAIIDKNARIGPGAVIHGDPQRRDETHAGWCVRDGIVVVEKNAVIPEQTRL